MMKVRFVSVVLSEEYIYRWEFGLYFIAAMIAREMRHHRIEEWPELKWADPALPGTWKLVFAWPEAWISDEV